MLFEKPHFPIIENIERKVMTNYFNVLYMYNNARRNVGEYVSLKRKESGIQARKKSEGNSEGFYIKTVCECNKKGRC